uniref:Uncharacterized protein n=1 Tax=Glossina pallidipes TaxID=7398 RepID=A0A1A9ZNY9_GLOPL
MYQTKRYLIAAMTTLVALTKCISGLASRCGARLSQIYMRNSVVVAGLIGRWESRLYHLELVYNDVVFAEEANMYAVGDAAGWKMRTTVINRLNLERYVLPMFFKRMMTLFITQKLCGSNDKIHVSQLSLQVDAPFSAKKSMAYPSWLLTTNLQAVCERQDCIHLTLPTRLPTPTNL